MKYYTLAMQAPLTFTNVLPFPVEVRVTKAGNRMEPDLADSLGSECYKMALKPGVLSVRLRLQISGHTPGPAASRTPVIMHAPGWQVLRAQLVHNTYFLTVLWVVEVSCKDSLRRAHDRLQCKHTGSCRMCCVTTVRAHLHLTPDAGSDEDI